MKYIETWDLEAIFQGGTKSPELQTKLHKIHAEIQEYQKLIHEWDMTVDQICRTVKSNIKETRNH